MERLETQYNQAVQNFGRNSQEAKQLKQELNNCRLNIQQMGRRYKD